ALARDAARNLAGYGSIDLRHGDGSGALDEQFDAMLVNAGVTHPLGAWLDALALGGRMLVPITASMPAIAATIGKGGVVLVTRDTSDSFSARVIAVVAVYSALGIRDSAMDERIGKALMGGPAQWQSVKRLRRDAHTPEPTCWLHRDTCCFSSTQTDSASPRHLS